MNGDQHGTIRGFVALGLVMIAAAALPCLADAVAFAFVALGSGLVIIGGLAGQACAGRAGQVRSWRLEFVLARLSEAC